MIQRNADHRSPMNFSSESSLRSGRQLLGSEPKRTAHCWPFPVAARFVAATEHALASGAARQAASSFIS
jgi:hypothetical protein